MPNTFTIDTNELALLTMEELDTLGYIVGIDDMAHYPEKPNKLARIIRASEEFQLPPL